MLVNFGTEKKKKFKMVAQNFDTPKLFFQFILKVAIYSSISENFSSCVVKIKENIADLNSGL